MPEQPPQMFTPPEGSPDVSPAAAGPPAPTRIIELAAGFMVSKTLFAAIDIGLFAAAGPDGGTAAELAERCAIPERSARAMADLLADIFTEPLPGGHDAVLVANVVHLFPPERIAELLRRLREAITPDGRLLLVDWWRTDVAPASVGPVRRRRVPHDQWGRPVPGGRGRAVAKGGRLAVRRAPAAAATVRPHRRRTGVRSRRPGGQPTVRATARASANVE
jgi:SAM-dependent methyltransferase